jgi:hypothetical protein
LALPFQEIAIMQKFRESGAAEMNAISPAQAIHDRCKDLGLSLTHAQRLAAENDHTDPQSLLRVLGLNLATLAQPKPRRWLWMAAQTASVSYR